MTKPLAPNSIIGILGGGQLGRMMAIAAAEMGYRVHIYCPEAHSPASEVACYNTIDKYEDMEAIMRFAKSVDVVTYEFENIPSAPVEAIAGVVNIFPSPKVLATSQHRVLEKTAVNGFGIATAPFVPVSSYDELLEAVKKLGLPAVLKTATMGYDGKGQVILCSEGDVENLRTGELGNLFFDSPSPQLILEGFVPFKMEISVIVARDKAGEVRCYCPVQNIHKHHILAETIAPAPISPELAAEAEKIAKTIAIGLDLVGLMAIEMFVAEDNKILVNELAPRPHNSGHWTMDACITSQFEQSIRAVSGLPLGDPSRMRDALMINLIGDDVADAQDYLNQPNAKLHLYGKQEARAGRKMGHVTFLG